MKNTSSSPEKLAARKVSSLNREELSELTQGRSSASSAVSPMEEFERFPREQESLKFRSSLYFASDLNAGHVFQRAGCSKS